MYEYVGSVINLLLYVMLSYVSDILSKINKWKNATIA